jgi:hypothetical protein
MGNIGVDTDLLKTAFFLRGKVKINENFRPELDGFPGFDPPHGAGS